MSLILDERGRALENEYFRKKEQELLDKMKSKIESEDAKQLELKCPKCGGTLHETEFNGIIIDVCGECHGAWFDAGEIAQIAVRQDGGFFSKIFG